MEATSNTTNIISLIQLRSNKEEVIVDGSTDLFTIIRTLARLQIMVGPTYYDIPPNKLLFIGPGTRIQLIEGAAEAGYRITFPDSFFDRSNKDAEILYSRLFFDYDTEIQIVDAVRPPEEVRHALYCRAPMFAEKSLTLYHAALKNHIESLLLEGLLGLPDVGHDKPGNAPTERNLVNSFIVTLHQHYKEENSVHFYADALNVTPRKLSAACQKIFDRTAKGVISETITKRAINHIQNSTLSISQIAFEMGFSDESNFRRFIKKRTGKTALSFRTT